jgi:hypothetical protein
VIAHALALGGGVAFIAFTYVIVVSPMAQFFPRSLLRWIEGEWIRYRGVEFGFVYVPAISDPLQGFKKKGAGDRHPRVVTDMSNVCNWAKADGLIDSRRSPLFCPNGNPIEQKATVLRPGLAFSAIAPEADGGMIRPVSIRCPKAGAGASTVGRPTPLFNRALIE